MNQPTVKKCPYCAEEILAEAIKCKHCGERLDVQQSAVAAASPAPVSQPQPQSVPPAGQQVASPGGVPVSRWVLAGIASLIVAAVVGAFANGVFQAMEANKAARQIGYGLSGRDVMGLQRELGDGPGCTGGGAATFFLVWGVVGYALRPKRPGSTSNAPSAGSAVFQPVFMTYTLAGTPSVFLVLVQTVLTRGSGAEEIIFMGLGSALALAVAAAILAGGGALVRREQRKMFSTVWLVLSVLFNLFAAVVAVIAFASSKEVAMVFQALAALAAPLGPFVGRNRLLALP